MFKWSDETRVREVTEQERIARASGWHKAKANWLVERFGENGPTQIWYEISSHESEGAANAAKIKLDCKIAKGQ